MLNVAKDENGGLKNKESKHDIRLLVFAFL